MQRKTVKPASRADQLCSGECGQVVLITAVSLVVVLGVAALAIDVKPFTLRKMRARKPQMLPRWLGPKHCWQQGLPPGEMQPLPPRPATLKLLPQRTRTKLPALLLPPQLLLAISEILGIHM
jgi:hypothetical protein